MNFFPSNAIWKLWMRGMRKQLREAARAAERRAKGRPESMYDGA